MISTVVAVVVRLLLERVFSYHHAYVTLYLAVLWSAWYGGLGPALVSTGLGAISAVYAFLPPLRQGNGGVLLGLEFFLIVSISAAIFTQKLHKARRRAMIHADVAERRLAELTREVAEHARAERRLQETQKFESIGLLAGGIAHEFNNLLTGIIGNASLATSVIAPDDPARRYLNEVLTAADRSAKLVQQLLAYAGKGEFVIDNVELSDVVRNAVDLVRPSVPRNIQFRVALQPDLPAVRGDANQFQQLVTNLITNGVEALGDKDGIVSVATGAIDLAHESALAPQIGEITPGSYSYVAVTDTGPGIRPDLMSHIFDPFFTTKFLGRGLGLAAVSGIVRAHKGAVSVVNRSGYGVTFTVYLPTVTDAPRSRSDSPSVQLQ